MSEVVGVVGVVEVRKVSQIGRSCRVGMVWCDLVKILKLNSIQ